MLGILEFLVKLSRNFRLGDSRISYYVIPQLDLGISIWNSRILCDEIPRRGRGMTN